MFVAPPSLTRNPSLPTFLSSSRSSQPSHRRTIWLMPSRGPSRRLSITRLASRSTTATLLLSSPGFAFSMESSRLPMNSTLRNPLLPSLLSLRALIPSRTPRSHRSSSSSPLSRLFSQTFVSHSATMSVRFTRPRLRLRTLRPSGLGLRRPSSASRTPQLPSSTLSSTLTTLSRGSQTRSPRLRSSSKTRPRYSPAPLVLPYLSVRLF
mmetsp:Transcript_3128/g.6310  ORF Transcript_3128/g.6310 Transcript_3128/m.6310 type:complete len:208 (+) Transcript_3128:701-1324(+)